MAATFTWTIPTVERVLADGGITIAHWRCDAVEDTYSAGSYGTVGLTLMPLTLSRMIQLPRLM